MKYVSMPGAFSLYKADYRKLGHEEKKKIRNAQMFVRERKKCILTKGMRIWICDE